MYLLFPTFPVLNYLYLNVATELRNKFLKFKFSFVILQLDLHNLILYLWLLINRTGSTVVLKFFMEEIFKA